MICTLSAHLTRANLDRTGPRLPGCFVPVESGLVGGDQGCGLSAGAGFVVGELGWVGWWGEGDAEFVAEAS